MYNRIAEIIKKENLSNSQFAQLVGIQPSAVTHLLNGRNEPSIQVTKKILDTFRGINPEWFLFGVGEMYRKAPEQTENNVEIKKETKEIKTEEPKDLIVPINRVCCKMPWNYMMICDDGNVLLTGSCVKRIGNIYENSINEIWNSSVAQEYRKLMIEKKFPDDMCRTECTGRW